jgi:rhodanese-related sulfurtransferase
MTTHSRRLRAALLAASATALLGAPGCGGDDPPSKPAAERTASRFATVSPQQIAPRVEAGEVLLVDVREQAEWDAGRAPGAVHIPLAEVGERLDEIRERADGRPVAFICRSGNRSAQASRIAVDGGVDGVINVDGGMGAWAAAKLPLVPASGTIL